MKEETLQHLKDLQAKHRLAAHIWEGNTLADAGRGIRIPQEDSLKYLQDMSSVYTYLGRGKPPTTLSMTLLAPEDAHRGTKLYMVADNETGRFGYLFDVSQTGQHHPIITEIADRDLYTDFDATKKRPKMPYIIRALYENDRSFNLPEEANTLFYEMLAGEEGAQHTERMLDELGSTLKERSDHVVNRAAADNEILVAAGKEHIQAIVVPAHDNPLSLSPVQTEQSQADILQLQGALVGLKHVNAGMDFPVMLYCSKGERKGQIIPIGQGKEELRSKALEAIKSLQGDAPQMINRYFGRDGGSDWIGKGTLEEAAELLHIDVTKPIDAQTQWRDATAGPRGGGWAIGEKSQ